VDGVVLAEPNHCEGSSLREIAPFDAFQRLLAQAYRIEDSSADRSRLVEAVSHLTRVRLFELRLGDLADAERLLGDLPAPSR
jgi:hypothetical protein